MWGLYVLAVCVGVDLDHAVGDAGAFDVVVVRVLVELARGLLVFVLLGCEDPFCDCYVVLVGVGAVLFRRAAVLQAGG